MRLAAFMVGVVALASILVSTGFVVTKDYAPVLSVEVRGVPGYIYYNRTYDLTIEYANHGGPVTGPVELAAVLPETFALADQIKDPLRHGERLVWTLDGLDTGQKGSVKISVRGTLPADLSEAVYDLPGYAGHTAFVEGFEMPVTLTAGSSATAVTAIADTGSPSCSGTCVDVFVYVDFSDNASDILTINLSCDTSSVTTIVDQGSESSAASFRADMNSSFDTCQASDSSGLPSGYSVDYSDCSSFSINDTSGGSCTLYINLNSATFTVYKDYSSAGPSAVVNVGVSISLNCGSGSVEVSPLNASPGSPAEFTVTGITGTDTTCTATEEVPSGYTSDEATTCLSITLEANGSNSCTITNTLNSATFTVYKAYVPSGPTDTVSVALSCGAGSVTLTPKDAGPGSPAEFTVTGITGPDTTCTATETVPAGYTSDEASTCLSITLGANGSADCTITNSTTATVTVQKDYSPNFGTNTAVTITLTCTGGSIDDNTLTASEGSPAVFTVTGFDTGDACSASESDVPTGWAESANTCTEANLALTIGSNPSPCTITNTTSATITVQKDYSPDYPLNPTVTITLSCTGGIIDDNTLTAKEGTPAVFTVTGFSTGAACSASESGAPSGWAETGNTCTEANLALTAGGSSPSSCTITNYQAPDADSDGVPDEIDDCSGTVPGAAMLPNGCSVKQATPIVCATMSFTRVIIGTNDNDVLTGTSGADLIFGVGGADTINGVGGNDCIVGGAGNDVIDGGAGADLVYGSGGDDTINGGIGNDKLYGEAGADTLNGGNDNDRLYGGDDNDTLSGGNGNDQLTGEGGTDNLNGGVGTDGCSAIDAGGTRALCEGAFIGP